MSTPNPAKSLLFAALGLAAVSAAVFGFLIWQDRATAPIGRPALSAPPYTPAAIADAVVKSAVWSPPAALARGRDWLYDVFTPPEIFYNPRTRQFSVSAASVGGSDQPDEPFGLELISVRPEPFRLQLIGYVGGEGDARGIFENRVSGEIFLASAGHRVGDLGLSVRRFSVRSEEISIPESMGFKQRVGTAVVADARAGRDVILTQRERRMTGNVFAFVAVEGESAPREVRPGDSFKVGTAAYRIEQINAELATIDVVKTSPDLDEPWRRTLPVRFDSSDLTPSAP
jgi:hypothetical protein